MVSYKNLSRYLYKFSKGGEGTKSSVTPPHNPDRKSIWVVWLLLRGHVVRSIPNKSVLEGLNPGGTPMVFSLGNDCFSH